MSSSYHQLTHYTGSRYTNSNEIERICNTWDDLEHRDAMIMSVALFSQKASVTTPAKAIKGSHFHMPSTVDQRIFHAIDRIIFDAFPDLDFIDISPVQPLGLNGALAHLSQSRILSTVRGSEVNADITTALFRQAYKQFLHSKSQPIEIGGMARITRAQSYNPKTKFLPHFRMFGHVTVARAGKSFTTTVIGHLLRHICNDIDLMDSLMTLPNSPLEKVELELGETRLMNELIRRGIVDENEIRRHTTDPEYDVFERFEIDLPRTLSLSDDNLYRILRQYGLENVVEELQSFYSHLLTSRPDIAQRTYIRLSRIADTGYYEGICFNIYGTNKDGVRLPIANGGYTDWAAIINSRPSELCIISGIGEELIAKYYYPNTTVVADDKY